MTCTEECWTAVPCPDHGDLMQPFGRSAGLEAHQCCENYQKSDINPRHLWSEHDSTRWYTDSEGWEQHEASCEQCAPEPEPEMCDWCHGSGEGRGSDTTCPYCGGLGVLRNE